MVSTFAPCMRYIAFLMTFNRSIQCFIINLVSKTNVFWFCLQSVLLKIFQSVCFLHFVAVLEQRLRQKPFRQGDMGIIY